MDLKPVVFAVVLGWIGGDKELSPMLLDWLTTGGAGKDVGVITCGNGVVNDFVLRQVRLDSTPVELAQPTPTP
jgi:hypothetical protein